MNTGLKIFVFFYKWHEWQERVRASLEVKDTQAVAQILYQLKVIAEKVTLLTPNW